MAKQLGIDIGSSSIKLVLMENGNITGRFCRRHHGRLVEVLIGGIESLLKSGEVVLCSVTGNNSGVLTSRISRIGKVRNVPAVTDGVLHTIPQAGSIIDIGGQGSRFITDLQGSVPQFSENEHCAGGTGSFFDDQMSRLGMKIEDFSDIVSLAQSVPRLSGRCAVFAKTDIIHRQQEGVSTPDILLGLCYAMIRNYKAMIVRDLPVVKPVVFAGGVTQNTGAVRAITEVFDLKEGELIIPKDALYMAAIGAALSAQAKVSAEELLDALNNKQSVQANADDWVNYLDPLKLSPGTSLSDPEATGIIPEDGCALGIDIGSTSTDLVLTGRDGSLVDYQYLRTAGNPEGAVRAGLSSIRERFGDVTFLAVGVTGSGRTRVGNMINADAVIDEITSQAKAAVRWVPDVDTVFEIGGQDSKYISIRDGEVADFQMNKICAAGTGAFIEEQAGRMGIPINEFGPLALTSTSPKNLGEHCTVFIESSIEAAQAEGVPPEDIAAGLCHAIVNNYLHKVVSGRLVGEHIVLQGGIAYNPGIVAAFQEHFPESLTVSPCFSISGACGAALLALEAVGDGPSKFTGFVASPDDRTDAVAEDVRRNTEEYRSQEKALLSGYDGTIDPAKETVGIPFVLTMHRFFPLFNTFFKELGYNVILSELTNDNTIQLASAYSRGETCYPMKLVYGHIMELVQKGVDYVFLPNVRSVTQSVGAVQDSTDYNCVYTQAAPRAIAKILQLEEKGITFLNPAIDPNLEGELISRMVLDVGLKLGRDESLCNEALLKGLSEYRKVREGAIEQGRKLIEGLGADEKVMVMVSRHNNVCDPALNLGIPDMLLERGFRIIKLEDLPVNDISLEAEYPHLCWPFGQHIIAGARMIAHHPNLYAIYLTNHGCGPDSMLSHMLRQEMGDKPFLQIEVDEHYSKVGVVTRVEAFLNSISHRDVSELPEDFRLTDVEYHDIQISDAPPDDPTAIVYVPDLGRYTKYICEYLNTALGLNAQPLDPIREFQMAIGRSGCMGTEYLPFTGLFGSAFYDCMYGWHKKKKQYHYLIPSSLGAEADSQYARAIRSELDRRGYTKYGIWAPPLELLPIDLPDPGLLFDALLTGDLLYMMSSVDRLNHSPSHIARDDDLLLMARDVARNSRKRRRLAIVGTPMMLTSMNERVLDELERRGEYVLRAPLSEYMLFLWEENEDVRNGCADFLERCRHKIERLHAICGRSSSFSADPDRLHELADETIGDVNGANIRYRFAKAIRMGDENAAVISVAPRYENTALLMEMHGIRDHVKAPFTQAYFDGDWDEPAWERLLSFLHYCQA